MSLVLFVFLKSASIRSNVYTYYVINEGPRNCVKLGHKIGYIIRPCKQLGLTYLVRIRTLASLSYVNSLLISKDILRAVAMGDIIVYTVLGCVIV